MSHDLRCTSAVEHGRGGLPTTRRVYNLGLDESVAWLLQEQRPAGFTKATLTASRVALEARKLGPIPLTYGSRLSESWHSRQQTTDCSRRTSVRIARIKGVKLHGIRARN